MKYLIPLAIILSIAAYPALHIVSAQYTIFHGGAVMAVMVILGGLGVMKLDMVDNIG